MHDDFFQQLADGAPVMIWMSGLDMGCFYFNRAWLDFRGRTLEEEQGNGWAEGVHPDDMERCVNHYVACFERRLAFAMSYRLQHHTGEYRWILDRGAPHHLPDGTFLGYYGGCAEIVASSTIDRHLQLHSSLVAMKGFARRIATEGVITMRALKSSGDTRLGGSTDSRREVPASDLRRAQMAESEMSQLAEDMVAHADIGEGVCLPEIAGTRG